MNLNTKITPKCYIKDIFRPLPINTLRKSNVILWLYFGNLRKLLSGDADVTQS